jgi:hypothetical protein
VCIDFEVMVSKTAQTSYSRSYEWQIEKTANVSDLLLSVGQHYTVGYSVDVGARPTDFDFSVFGDITVYNPAPFPAQIIAIEDRMGGKQIETDCPANALDVELLPGESFVCSYQTTVSDKSAGQNQVEVKVSQSSQVGGNRASADYSFGDPDTVADECVDLDDSLVGALGRRCVDDLPLAALYLYEIVAGECGEERVVENVATATANDTGDKVWDHAFVNVSVAECDMGCTLTQGYWKTHSRLGPAPYDDTWAMLTSGALTPFFTIGMSYHSVLWTPPKGGNVYLILAHQFIAAELNALAGTSVPQEAIDAMSMSADLLVLYAGNPNFIGLKGKGLKKVRARFIELAGVLASYNEGVIGPGHCDE